MLTGACRRKGCNKKGDGHEYGSMQTGAIIFEKNYDIRFFQFVWNGEQKIKYLFYYLLMDNIFV